MPDAPPVLTVFELTSLLKEVIENTFPRVWVAGEISNCLKAGSGHFYFTLKDEDAQLKAVMWRNAAQRLKFTPQDGLQVIAAGTLEVYPPRGQYQMIVDRLEPQGTGALELAFRQLQAKLEAEGLFDPARKRPLPRFPRRIALITSPQGAAVRDMLQVITRRWPAVHVVVIPVAVQGDGAARQIAAALKQVHQIPEVDVVICGRGGGSLEDLWAFNEEPVARAIAACKVPVISAVGHEIDVTIADLVADRRALTPSEAGELVVPLVTDVRQQLQQFQQRLVTGLRAPYQRGRLKLDGIAQRRCFTHPWERLRQLTQQLDETSDRMRRGMRQQWSTARDRLENLATALQALSPLGVVQRGYALVKRLPDGTLVRSVRQLQPGEQLSILLTDGEVISRVESLAADADE